MFTLYSPCCTLASKTTRSVVISRFLGGLLAFIICIVTATNGHASSQEVHPSREYQIRASLIFNFLQFVTWPPAETQMPTLHICVAGRDLFGSALSTLEQEIVQGRRIQVTRLVGNEEPHLEGCQVLVVNTQSVDVTPLLEAARQQSILTIGDSDDFLDKGGMISIVVENDKVVFDINRASATVARLDISSKLLRVARVVKG